MPCKMDSGAMYEGVPISWQMDHITWNASDRSIDQSGVERCDGDNPPEGKNSADQTHATRTGLARVGYA